MPCDFPAREFTDLNIIVSAAALALWLFDGKEEYKTQYNTNTPADVVSAAPPLEKNRNGVMIWKRFPRDLIFVTVVRLKKLTAVVISDMAAAEATGSS